MSDENWQKLLKLYYELSDFYFDNMPEDETTQDERESLNDACETLLSVLRSHSNSERKDLLP